MIGLFSSIASSVLPGYTRYMCVNAFLILAENRSIKLVYSLLRGSSNDKLDEDWNSMFSLEDGDGQFNKAT